MLLNAHIVVVFVRPCCLVDITGHEHVYSGHVELFSDSEIKKGVVLYYQVLFLYL